MKKNALIALFGAFGGVISWILGNAAGNTNQLGIPNIFLSICAHALIGAACAFFAINFGPIDLSQFNKVLALSLACGVCWQPVIASMGRAVSGISTKNTTARLQQQKNDIEQNIQDPTKVSSALRETPALLAETTAQTKNTDDAEQKERLQQSAKDVIYTIPKAAQVDPIGSYQALSKIGVSSINSDQRTLAFDTLDALEKSAPSGCKSVTDETCKEYQRSIHTIKAAAVNKSWSDVANRAVGIETSHPL